MTFRSKFLQIYLEKLQFETVLVKQRIYYQDIKEKRAGASIRVSHERKLEMQQLKRSSATAVASFPLTLWRQMHMEGAGSDFLLKKQSHKWPLSGFLALFMAAPINPNGKPTRAFFYEAPKIVSHKGETSRSHPEKRHKKKKKMTLQPPFAAALIEHTF